MKTNLKQRICVFLCLLLVLPGILAALPKARLTVQAAGTVSVNWSNNMGAFSGTAVEFRMGKNTTGFYMGDYLNGYVSSENGYKISVLSLNSGVTYKSNNTSVVTINKSTGLVTPKKNGTAKVTITFKRASKDCTIQVVSSVGKLSNNYTALKKVQMH